MNVDYNQFLAIVYADMFDFPLTVGEAKLWAVAGKGQAREVQIKDGFCFLKGREKIVALRKEREKISADKILKMGKILRILKEINTIEAVFLTGSVAVSNAKENSDIDLMIVTSVGTLWRTRIRVLGLLRKLRILRNGSKVKNRICANIFLDANNLEITEKNLYTAHEILLANCVFDRGGILRKWLEMNLWIKEFLPNAVRNRKKFIPVSSSSLQNPLEIMAFILQYIYMRPKMTMEKVGLGYAFFHPLDGSKFFVDKFRNKLKSLGIMDEDEAC